MKTRISIKGFKLDRTGFTKTFNEMLDRELRNAARQWLLAVIERVPVWLGTARGSLIPLGQFLRIPIPITPSSSPHAFARPNTGPAAGAAQGFFEFKHLQKQVKFTFRTEVFHYAINEFYDPRPEVALIHEPIPWHSFQEGRKAFDRYLAENLKRKIPKIKDFMIREDIYIKD